MLCVLYGRIVHVMGIWCVGCGPVVVGGLVRCFVFLCGKLFIADEMCFESADCDRQYCVLTGRL